MFVELFAGLWMTLGDQSPAPSSPPIPALVVELVEDATAAQAYDYPALMAAQPDPPAFRQAVVQWVNQRAGAKADGRGGRCQTEGEGQILDGLAAVETTPDAAAWRADRDAAAAMLARYEGLSAAILAGAPQAEPPFSYVTDRMRMAASATDPRVADLLGRAARDQLVRRGYSDTDGSWTGPMSSGSRARFNAAMSRRACILDHENTEWLKADLAANGWYRLSRYEAAADTAAWLMVQHADNDPEFQAAVLAMLEPLVATGDARPANYAYLYDRVAMNAGRPLRYGTQGRCAGPGEWVSLPLEDPARVEALREWADIGPLADYEAHMGQYCAAASK